MDVRIPANARDCEQVQLWSRDRKCQGEGIIKSWIAINDDREWRGRCADWRCSWREGCVMEGGPANTRAITAQ